MVNQVGKPMPQALTARYENGCLAVYCLIFVGLALQTSLLGATLEGLSVLYREEKNGATSLSESIMGKGAGYLVGTFITGFIFDAYAKKAHVILFAFAILLSVSTALIPVYPLIGGDNIAEGSGRWLLLLGLFFQALVGGSIDLGGNVLLTRVFASNVHRLNPRMNLLHLSWGVGATLGPLIAVGLGLSSDRLIFTYGITALISVILSLPILMINAPPLAKTIDNRHQGSNEKKSKALQIGTKTEGAVVTPTSESLSSAKITFRRPGVSRSITLLCLFYFFYAGVEHTIGDWIAVFSANAPVGVDLEMAAITVSVYFGSMSVGRLLAAAVTSRLSWAKVMTPSRVIVGSMLLAVVSMLLMAISGAYYIVVLFATVVGIGLSLAAVYPGAITFAQEKFQATGSQTSIFVSGAPLGGLIWPTIIGILMRSLTSTAMPWASMFLALCCLLCFVFVQCTKVDPLPNADHLNICQKIDRSDACELEIVF